MEKNRLRRFGRLALVVAQAAQGYGNATLDANQALWELARRAAAAPGVRAALLTAPRSAAPTAVEQAGDAAFLGAWRAFLDRYGWRSEGWDLGCPTWQERPAFRRATAALPNGPTADATKGLFGGAREVGVCGLVRAGLNAHPRRRGAATRRREPGARRAT
jgi:hypothetical protein